MDRLTLMFLPVFIGVTTSQQCPLYHYYDPVALQCFPCIEACSSDSEAFQRICQQQCPGHTTDGTTIVRVLHSLDDSTSNVYTYVWIALSVVLALLILGLPIATLIVCKRMKKENKGINDIEAQVEMRELMASSIVQIHEDEQREGNNQTRSRPYNAVLNAQIGTLSGNESLCETEEEHSFVKDVPRLQLNQTDPLSMPVCQVAQLQDSPAESTHRILIRLQQGATSGTSESSKSTTTAMREVGRPYERNVMSVKEEIDCVTPVADQHVKVME